MNYSDRIKAARAKYINCTHTPTPEPIEEPDIYNILNVKLIQPHRSTYFSPVGQNTVHRATHLVQLKMCGAPMQTIRHQIQFYAVPPAAKIVQDTLDTPPLITGYTRPFLFHSTQQAHDEIRHFLNTQI